MFVGYSHLSLFLLIHSETKELLEYILGLDLFELKAGLYSLGGFSLVFALFGVDVFES